MMTVQQAVREANRNGVRCSMEEMDFLDGLPVRITVHPHGVGLFGRTRGYTTRVGTDEPSFTTLWVFGPFRTKREATTMARAVRAWRRTLCPDCRRAQR